MAVNIRYWNVARFSNMIRKPEMTIKSPSGNVPVESKQHLR